MIPMHVKDILTQIFAVLGSVFVICFANPTIIAAIVPMVVVFFVVQGRATGYGQTNFAGVCQIYSTSDLSKKHMRSCVNSPLVRGSQDAGSRNLEYHIFLASESCFKIIVVVPERVEAVEEDGERDEVPHQQQSHGVIQRGPNH